MTHRQIVQPRLGTRDEMAMCLRFTQSVFGAPVRFEFARQAWDAQQGRHPGELPPPGVASVAWFDHTGTYGNPPVKKNWGHVAIPLGDGRVLTSPLRYDQVGRDGLGQAVYPSLDAMMRDLGGNPRYLGYSTHINGLHVVEPGTPTPSGQEEDDDMNYIHIGGKAGARRGGLYAVFNGKKAIFLGGPAPAGVPSVTNEAVIAELQKQIAGLA